MIQMLIGMMGASEVKPFSREQQFITPGTYEFVVPRGVKQIKALVIGGGGGASTNIGGKGGGVISGIVPVTSGDVLTVVVGAVASTGGTSALIHTGETLLQGFGGTNSKRGATAYNELVSVLSNYNAVDLPTRYGKYVSNFADFIDDRWSEPSYGEPGIGGAGGVFLSVNASKGGDGSPGNGFGGGGGGAGGIGEDAAANIGKTGESGKMARGGCGGDGSASSGSLQKGNDGGSSTANTGIESNEGGD